MWLACCPGNPLDYLLMSAVFVGGITVTGLVLAILLHKLTRRR